MAQKTFFGLLGMLGVVFLLELIFRVLPVSTSTETGYYTDPLILTYPPHHRWTTATGWDLRNAQPLLSNNFGYVASRDFEKNNFAVALVGDSFVEASMLAAADRPGAQLERALNSRPVYSMGTPGTSLLDYAERIRFSHEHLDIRDFVILMERGDIKQSLCGSGNINGPCLDPKTLKPRIETLPAASDAKKIIRQSALAQYLFSQLKLRPEKLWGQLFRSAHPVESTPPATSPTESQTTPAAVNTDLDAVTNAFFARVKPHILGRLVIVIDSDRSALYQNKVSADPARTRFILLARAAGAAVIDTEPLFQAHLAQSSLKLDVGPYDGHLNAVGVKLIAQAAADALNRK